MKEEEMANPLAVLKESVIQKLEGGNKGSKFPIFHAHFEKSNDDLEAEKIPALKKEFLQISAAFCEGMELTSSRVEVSVPVHETGYSSLFGVPVEKDARETIGNILNATIEQCDLAIIAGCGFGRFSANSEKIREATEQLKESIETVFLSTPNGPRELRILAYDSSNNLKHGRAADGIWVPYRVIGLIKIQAIVLGFDAIMDYGSGVWSFNNLGINWLVELSENSVLFSDAYKKLTGNNFDLTIMQMPDPELISWLKESKCFQQAVNLVCRRWLNL